MIHYSLLCGAGHAFDGWFRDSGAFDTQVSHHLLTCPECGDGRVTRALMAPAIPRKGLERQTVPETAPAAPTPVVAAVETTAIGLPDQLRAALQRIRAEVERNSDYVGSEFAEEARRIHRGDSEKRNIHGEATPDQAEALVDEGIEVAQIPWVPRADG